MATSFMCRSGYQNGKTGARTALLLLVALASQACGGSGGGTAGSGGTTGAGGTRGIGGATGSGGATGVDAGAGSGGSPGGIGGGAGANNPDAAIVDGGADLGARTDAGPDTGARIDGGGNDGGAAYSPCPTNGSACIIMPLGDSITDGFPFENGGYRVELFHQAVQGATRITFVGRNMNGPTTVDAMPFPRGHEGYSGFTIDTDATHTGISPLVDAAVSMFHPHVILLHIGTNDINGNVALANAPTRLAALIDRIISDSPTSLLVVAEIIPTTTDATNTRVSAYNAAIPALVQQRAAMGKHIVLLDMYSVFTSRADYKTALMFDNLHPNVAGYAAMGDAWYATIRPALR